MIDKIRAKVINSIIEYPKRYLWLSLVVFIVILPGLARIGEDYSYRAWYHPQDPLLVRYDEFEKKFGNDDTATLILFNEKGLLNKESIKLIHQLTDKLWQVEYVTRVDSLTNFDYVRIGEEDQIDISPFVPEEDLEEIDDKYIEKLKQAIEQTPLIKEVFISKDEKLALIKGQLQPSFVELPDNQVIVNQLRQIKKEFEDGDHKILIGGTATIINYYKEIAENDLVTLLPLLYFLFTVVLIWIYRSKTGVFLPYLILTTSIALMMGSAGYLGEKLNSISSAAPNILMTVAIADAIHLLTVFYLGLKKGLTRTEALHFSLEKNFYPTILTSLTTAVGFFSFAGAKINAISMMGIEVGIGVIYAWLLTYFLLCPIIKLIPEKKDVTHGPATGLRPDQPVNIPEKFLQRVGLLFKLRYWIVGTTLAIALIGLFMVPKLEVNMDPFGQFKKHHPLVVANDLVEKHLGPASVVEIMIYAPEEGAAKEPAFLRKVEAFQTWLENEPYIHKATSIVDVIKDLNQKLNNNQKEYFRIPETKEDVAQELLFYSLGLPPGRELNNRISIKSDAIRLSATWNIHRSRQANEKIAYINSKAQDFGLNAYVTGKMPLFHDLTPYIVSSFTRSFQIALISITLIMVIVLKSFKLGLLALVPNLFPLLVGAAIYAFFGIEVDIASVLIASVVFGIAVDDSIHFLFEYRKFKNRGLKQFDNLAMIMQNTFPSLFNTTLVIVIGFGSFIIADYIPNAKFGISVAFCLSIALIADFIVLPVILMISERDQ